MKLRTSIVWSLIDALGVAVFVVFFELPTVHLPVWSNVLAIAIMEFAAFMGASMLARGPKGAAFLKVLILAFGFSLFLTYFLQGSFTYDDNFLILVSIQLVGLLFAVSITRQPGPKRYSNRPAGRPGGY